jgi:hypothetical protein
MVELAKQQLMLVAAEAFTKDCTECKPFSLFKTVSDRLEPTLGVASEMHSGNTYSHGRIDKIHVKI